jgi:hypothetical protein
MSHKNIHSVLWGGGSNTVKLRMIELGDGGGSGGGGAGGGGSSNNTNTSSNTNNSPPAGWSSWGDYDEWNNEGGGDLSDRSQYGWVQPSSDESSNQTPPVEEDFEDDEQIPDTPGDPQANDPGYDAIYETTPIYADYTTKISEILSPTSIKVETTWENRANTHPDVISTEYSGLETYPFKNPKIKFKYQSRYGLNNYLNFGGDNLLLTTNFIQDKVTFEKSPYSMVYKLYDKLPSNIVKKDYCYVVEEVLPPIEEDVFLIDFVEEDVDAVVLRNPKLNDVDFPINIRTTDYKTYDTLLTSDGDIRDELENKLLSGSSDSVELNVDYSRYKNFINFSSIEKRIRNFKYKLDQIETYSANSASHATNNTPVTASLTTEINRWMLKRRETINGFDGFEKYMYFESSSYVTSSLGEFYENSWPKTSGDGTFASPYVLSHTTSSEGVDWFDAQISSASLYDTLNPNYLLNNLPSFVVEDDSNRSFLDFVKMTGHYYDDNIFLYIKNMTSPFNTRDGLPDGMSKELVFDVAKSFGFNLKDGKDLVELPLYHMGYQQTGSESPTVYSVSSTQDISREISKRVLNNMPFFLKTKGTARALKGLINCYGIPSSILRVREYGGPDIPGSATSYSITKKFTKALNFKTGQFIKTTWIDNVDSGRKPDTVEFRFKSLASDGSTNRVLTQSGASWALRLIDNGSVDNIGRVGFIMSGSAGYSEVSSSELPVFDGEFYSVMLNRVSSSGAQLSSDSATQNIDYNLSVKKYDASRSTIYLSSTVSMSVDGTTSSSYNSSFIVDNSAYIGGNGSTFGSAFTGSMMEFRYWNTALTMSAFDNHVSAPKAYDGNHASASWEDLILRYSFDDNSNLDVDGDIRDTSSNQTYYQTGSASGYTVGNRPHFSSVVDEQKMFVPNIGPNRKISSKIRIETNTIEPNTDGTTTLVMNKRKEKSAFDSAPLDSNKVGIYFSPSDAINEDIMQSMANLDFNQYLGDPRDEYSDDYRGLQSVRDSYWRKYTSPNNLWDYIRLLKYYDMSLFDNIKGLLPARSNAVVGLLIEGNMLERSKVAIQPNKPSVDNLYYDTTIDVSGHTADRVISIGSDSVLPSVDGIGDVNYYEASSSYSIDYLQRPSLAKFNGNNLYTTASINVGGPEYVFIETVQPIVTGSRPSAHNEVMDYFYSSVASHSLDMPSSSSYSPADGDTSARESLSFRRLYFEGCLQTKNTTPDGLIPVEVTLTSPTVLVTSEPGESTLNVDGPHFTPKTIDGEEI